MTKMFKQWIQRTQDAGTAIGRSAGVFCRDVGHGFLEVSHNTFALLGLAVVALVVFGAGRADMRHAAESRLFGWLQARHEARLDPLELLASDLRDPGAIARATAVNPKELDRQQAAVAHWISRRYRVAPEPIARLVQEAWVLGGRVGLDPTLILGIMAVESSFNPFAQSSVGAQGLMQVMTRVHDQKYQPFGGTMAAFDPVTNLRVGVLVLKECISRAGSVEAGLRFYVGAANLPDDGGYAGKVMAEAALLRAVAQGRSIPAYTPLPPAAPSAVPVKADGLDGTRPAEAPATEAETRPPAAERVALLQSPAR